MSAAKTERLMNLYITLLVATRFVTKDKLRDALYPEAADEAFEKMFERDKEELRSLGVPVEVGSNDAYFDDELGYRIRPEAAQLPQIDLTQDEAQVVALATQVWENATLADAATEAVRKLQAGGMPVDTAIVDIAPPRVRADEPVFDDFLAAAGARRVIQFDYRGSRDTAPQRRTLQTWGVVRHANRWYVVGFDLDRQAERIFRLSRVIGEPVEHGPAGAYEIPEVNLGEIARGLAPRPTATHATVLVRPGTCHALRSWSSAVEAGVTAPDGTMRDRLTIEQTRGDLVAEILACGADAYVEGEPALRDEVIRRVMGVSA